MGPTREEVLKAEQCNGFASWDDDDVLCSALTARKRNGIHGIPTATGNCTRARSC